MACFLREGGLDGSCSRRGWGVGVEPENNGGPSCKGLLNWGWRFIAEGAGRVLSPDSPGVCGWDLGSSKLPFVPGDLCLDGNRAELS